MPLTRAARQAQLLDEPSQASTKEVLSMPSAVALKLQAAREKQSRARKANRDAASGDNDGVREQAGDQVTIVLGVTDALEDEGSSSTDDSDGLPPDPSNVRRGPSEIGPTLRPSPLRRAAAQPTSRKRGRSEMGLEESAPRVKRRLFSGDRAGSDVNDRQGETPVATARVGPGVLNVFNQGSKKLQGASKCTFTIDLPSKRKSERSPRGTSNPSAEQQEGAQSLTSSWPDVREETLEEEEDVEEEAETDLAKDLNAVEEEDRDEEAEQQADAEMGRAEGQKEAQEVPTLQLFQPPTPKLAKPAKKSKPRRPKTAFEDRPLAEQAIPVKPSSNLKHSNPKQTAHQIDETDTTEHFRQLFQGDQASHLRRQQRPDNVYEFSEPELEPPQLQPSDTRSNDDPANVSLDHDELDEGENASFVDLGSDDHSVAVPSVVAPSPAAIAAKQAVFEGPTVEIPLVTVRSMMMDMASKNWTGHGRRWMEEALDAVSFDGPTNATVQECWECLIDLRRKWAKVPRYPKLARQYLFAQQEADATRKDTKSVLSLISEVCEQLVQEQDRGNRETLQHDVVNFIVPWLVVLLRQFALLGGSTKKEGGQRQLPDVGTFIEPAVQLLAHACRWLQYINTALANVINSDLEAWAENKGPTMSLLTVNVAERRLGLISKITDFKEQVHKALEYFKDVREEPIRRAKIAQREAEIRLKKEQEEEAERQRREARAEAMRKSNERLRQAPDPMVEKWHRKVEHEEQLARFLAGQTTFVSTQRAVPHHQPVQGKAVQRDEFDGYFSSSPGSPRSGGGPAAPRRDGDAVRQARHGIVSTPQLARAEPPLFIGNDDGQSVAGPSARKWEPEEDEFLIAELQSRSGRPLRSNDFRLWAEVLDREVSEIQREVTRLKVATRMVAEERGMRIPPWAEEPDSW